MPCSAAASGIRSSRRSSLLACCSHLLGHAGLGDRLLQVLDLGRRALVLAQLLPDRRQLLAQQRLALALLQRAAGGLAQLARQAQHAQALVEELEHPVDAAGEVEGLQHLLLLARADVHGAGDQVGELARPSRCERMVSASSRGACGSSSTASSARSRRSMKRASISVPLPSGSSTSSKRAARNG